MNETSIKTSARIAGVLYLVNIVLGFFAVGYVPAQIIVSGDASATAHNIITQQGLYRMGLAAHIIILLTNIPLAVLFYRLFKVVNKTVAQVIVFFTIVGTSIEAVNLLNEFIPLLLLNGGAYHAAFTPGQLQSLSYTFHQLTGTGFNLALVFFGCYGMCAGYVIFKSTFLPRGIGMFMAIGGFCYVFNSFANFLAPHFARSLFPFIQLPSGLAELTFCLWLLIAGVDMTRWKEKQINLLELKNI
jgi:hypothetical protein